MANKIERIYVKFVIPYESPSFLNAGPTCARSAKTSFSLSPADRWRIVTIQVRQFSNIFVYYCLQKYVLFFFNMVFGYVCITVSIMRVQGQNE